jgi:hypothetical protein
MLRMLDGENELMHVEDRSQYLLERFMQPAEMLPLRESVIDGLKAGAVGGMALTVLVAGAYRAADLMPFRILAYGITRSEPIANSGVGVAVGVLAQIAWAIALGALFGVVMAKLVGRVGTAMTVAVGIVYGQLVWILGQYVVVGFIAPQAITMNDQQLLSAAHIVYGICLGLFGIRSTAS